MIERAVVEVFGGCNYSCDMCPQSTGRGASWTRKMPLDLFESILDQLPGKPIINLEGSGEPTMAKDLHKYIAACTERGLQSFVFTNGSFFSGAYMRRCIDAGLSFIRFSCIGYTPELYTKWMSVNNFELVRNNVRATQEYIEETGADTVVSSYHLILDTDNIDYELAQYRSEFIDKLGTVGYVWKMHNWSGNWDPEYQRSSQTKRTCGRPFAPEITIRAGGTKGMMGAVTPCCQTMGPPNEAMSILGDFQSQSFDEIWYGDKYNGLRKAHETGDWPDYCQGCDFLLDDPEVLVWSNDPTAKVHKMLGATDLSEYR